MGAAPCLPVRGGAAEAGTAILTAALPWAMPFRLDAEEQLLQQTVRSFAREQVGLEAAAERDRFDRFPADAVKAAGQLGLLGLADPANPLGATALVLAVDELAQVDANLAAAVAAHNACLAAAGPHPVAARLAAGELGAWLAAEEALGSDTAHPGTLAVRRGAGHQLTGQKVWGINAAAAEHFLVLAHVPDAGPTLLAVPASAQGISYGANEPLLGLRASGIRTIYFSDVEVPDAQAIGAPGAGVEAARAARTWLQLGAAAALCGCVAGAMEAAARFAESRIQFGAPIGSYQAVSDGLATMDAQLAAARSLVLAAAAQAHGPEAQVWAARAKAFAQDMAIPMTRQAIRVQGGTGFMREGGTERFARDARALQFVGETGQMQRDTLKRHLLPAIAFPPNP